MCLPRSCFFIRRSQALRPKSWCLCMAFYESQPGTQDGRAPPAAHDSSNNVEITIKQGLDNAASPERERVTCQTLLHRVPNSAFGMSQRHGLGMPHRLVISQGSHANKMHTGTGHRLPQMCCCAAFGSPRPRLYQSRDTTLRLHLRRAVRVCTATTILLGQPCETAYCSEVL